MARFYLTSAWQRARKQALHDAGYQCTRCHASLVGIGKRAHVHHRKPYLKAPALAIEPLNLQALCISCHNAVHGEIKRGRSSSACGADGRPTDPQHPWFRVDGAGSG
jgi:5-methylcytosine-specific restriction endonuclease McrA